MNQTVLAKKLGCSRKWVSDIEQGNETAEIGRVLRALAVLGIKIFVGQSEAVESKELSPQYKEILAHRDRFGGAPQAMDRMSTLGTVADPLKESLDRMSTLWTVTDPLKESLDRMSTLETVTDPLKESLDRMSTLWTVTDPLKESLDRMSTLGTVTDPLKESLDRMSTLGTVTDPLTKSLSEKTIGPKLLPALLPEAFKGEGQPSAATTEEASATKPQVPKPGDGEDD
ncbi:helix-turn-helix transcriptional regulator [Komagataeibacter europaeus]|uniref:helix-turn-helix transcriptional regulator n=1 Tax=Komagataeibacter europaeus TaxID=33995 RepID=UPI001E40A940|nr:helix-turn-helix transcriptional regulator [Komagataeibacter europaeus]